MAITMVLKIGPNQEMKRVVVLLAVGSSGGISFIFIF